MEKKGTEYVLYSNQINLCGHRWRLGTVRCGQKECKDAVPPRFAPVVVAPLPRYMMVAGEAEGGGGKQQPSMEEEERGGVAMRRRREAVRAGLCYEREVVGTWQRWWCRKRC